jgi:hypothetical protein
MSTPSATALSQKNAGKRIKEHESSESTQSPAVASLLSYAMLGIGAILLLTLIEFLDLQIQLTPVFESFSERFILTAYMGVNLAAGAVVGLLLGLVARAGSFLKRRGEYLLSGGRPRFIHRAVVWIALSFLAAVALNQVPEVHSYVTGLIIEAQKLPYVYGGSSNTIRLFLTLFSPRSSPPAPFFGCWPGKRVLLTVRRAPL